MKRQTFRAVLFIAILLLALAIHLSVANAAKYKIEPAIPYTTPRIYYQGSKVRINWFNTNPRIYTIVEYRERCTSKLCISYMRIAWRGYLPIGNTRITLKPNTRTHGMYKVY